MYLFIILITIALTSQTDLLYNNLTEVANMEQYRYIVIGYTIILSVFFAYKISYLFSRLSLKHHLFVQICIIMIAFMMIIGSLFPYYNNGANLPSQVHVLFSFVPCTSFLVLLFIFTRLLNIYNLDYYLKVHRFFDYGIQILVICIIIFARVNGILEILYIIFVCTYLFVIEKTMKNN